MNRTRLSLLVIFAIVIVGFVVFDIEQYFSLDYFKSKQAQFDAAYARDPLKVAALYVAIYVAVTAMSLPGAAILSLAGGAIFGLLVGVGLVVVAATIGATLAFLVSRYLFREVVQKRFSDKLTTINQGVEKDGVFYLFFLRLVPAFPFFVINLLMGLTPMRTGAFFFISLLGMLPGTLVYVNAGTQLAKIDTTSGILTPGLILSFLLLGIFPFFARRLVEWVKARRVLKPFAKPRVFDNNVVVIGGGSAGLVTAYIAAAVKSKVTLIERGRMGGDCLNTGCVPSKALIRSAKFLSHAGRAAEFGMRSASVDFKFAEVMERVRGIVAKIAPHDSVERYQSLGVDCIAGEARITSPYTVEVNGRELTTRSIVIATGARPFVPPIEGIEDIGYLTSDSIWGLRELPARLVVLGAGPIGCELAQCFARFGSKVVQIEMLERILVGEDECVSAQVAARMQADGVELLTGHKALACEVSQGEKVLVCEHDGAAVRIGFDEILVAVGRTANVEGFGLEELGISVDKTIETDEYLRTKYPNIFACGDVVGPYQFTHVCAHQAWYASVNALFGHLRKFKVDYSVIPWATFTEPEVARVGLNEMQAREKSIAYELTTYGIDELDRAIADSEAHGFVRVLTVPGKDKILGCTIVGEHAGDLITEFVTAMRHGLGLNKILGTIHIYPTLAEANKYAAGEWKKAHAPEKLLAWLNRYHNWRRQ